MKIQFGSTFPDINFGFGYYPSECKVERKRSTIYPNTFFFQVMYFTLVVSFGEVRTRMKALNKRADLRSVA